MLSVSFFIVMLSVNVLCFIILSVIMLSVIMLSVIMLSVIMLSIVMLSVILLCGIMLSVVAPFCSKSPVVHHTLSICETEVFNLLSYFRLILFILLINEIEQK
jgi:hypothetical protein